MPAWLVTPATGEPVTLAEAKSHLRLEVTDDDGDVGRMIAAARRHLEQVCWRAMLQQQWELVLPGFFPEMDPLELPAWTRRHFRCENEIRLPRGQLAKLVDEEDQPISAVESVKYIDEANVEHTLAAEFYSVDMYSVPPVLRPAPGKFWPTTYDRWDAVRIRYTVGWKGGAGGDFPDDLKSALLLIVSQLYEHRVPDVVGTIVSPINFAIRNLVEPYKLSVPG